MKKNFIVSVLMYFIISCSDPSGLDSRNQVFNVTRQYNIISVSRSGTSGGWERSILSTLKFWYIPENSNFQIVNFDFTYTGMQSKYEYVIWKYLGDEIKDISYLCSQSFGKANEENHFYSRARDLSTYIFVEDTTAQVRIYIKGLWVNEKLEEGTKIDSYESFEYELIDTVKINKLPGLD